MPGTGIVWTQRQLVGWDVFVRAAATGRRKFAVRPELAFALDFAGKIRLHTDGMLAAVVASRSQQATFSL